MFTATGQTRTFSGTVVDTSQPYRVTLAWTDAPGSTTGNAFRNDLDLTVARRLASPIAATCSRERCPSRAALRTSATTSRACSCPRAPSGAFTITVTASNINSDGVPNVGGAGPGLALVAYNGAETPVPNVGGRRKRHQRRRACGGGNGAIDPGGTVTVNLSLPTRGRATPRISSRRCFRPEACSRSSSPQSYAGLLAAGGSAVARPFSSDSGRTCGGSLVATLQLQDGAADPGHGELHVHAGRHRAGRGGTFSNTAGITIPSSGFRHPLSVVDQRHRPHGHGTEGDGHAHRVQPRLRGRRGRTAGRTRGAEGPAHVRCGRRGAPSNDQP